MSPGAGAAELGTYVKEQVEEINQKVMSKAYRVQNEMRNTEIDVLTNPSPSAPGNPPGVRSGSLRNDWKFSVEGGAGHVTVKGAPSVGYAGYLENGTIKMAARPYIDKITEELEPKVDSIFADL